MPILSRPAALILAAAFALSMLSPVPANAHQARCADRARVMDMLQSRFGESRRGMGLAADQAIMEIFASAETGSWTITVTFPGGTTCLLASGHGYEPVHEALPADDRPA